MRPRQIARIAERLATLPPAGWDDVTNPTTYTKLGSNNKPDFDFTNIGLLFPQNDAGEKIYITGQMRHAWEGSDGRTTTVHPHIHYVQGEAGSPTFALEYRFYANGGSIPSLASISTDDGPGLAFPYVSGSILQIIQFPAITLSGLGSSTWYDIVLYRDDNVVSGDVLVKAFDWHAKFDALGSRSEYSK